MLKSQITFDQVLVYEIFSTKRESRTRNITVSWDMLVALYGQEQGILHLGRACLALLLIEH